MATRRLGSHLQSFLDIQSVNQLVVDLPAFPLQQDVQTAIAVPHPAGSQVAKTNAEFGPLVAAALVAM